MVRLVQHINKSWSSFSCILVPYFHTSRLLSIHLLLMTSSFHRTLLRLNLLKAWSTCTRAILTILELHMNILRSFPLNRFQSNILQISIKSLLLRCIFIIDSFSLDESWSVPLVRFWFNHIGVNMLGFLENLQLYVDLGGHHFAATIRHLLLIKQLFSSHACQSLRDFQLAVRI